MVTSLYSLNDILNAKDMRNWFHFLFLEEHLHTVPEDMADLPLRLVAARAEAPWGGSLQGIVEQIVDTANLILEIQSGSRSCLHLHDWSKWEPKDESDIRDSNNTFLITPGKETLTGSRKPALIICPGGGYEFVSFQNEGTPIQMLAERNGYAAFTMRYSVSPSRYPKPQMDLLGTIAHIRKNAEQYNVDPDRIGIIGFSAGAHLCASCAGLYKELLPEGKPNAVVLGYPVITLKAGAAHEGSVHALLGREDEQMRERLSVEHMITTDYPPTFVWTCKDDDTVSCENTIRLQERLVYYKVKHECHLYPTGGHGCGLAYGNSAWDWSNRMFSFLEKVL